MKIGQFKCSQAEFKNRDFDSKFSYGEPVQIVGAVANSDGLRYLVIKHDKRNKLAQAQFKWFLEHKFQCFAEGLNIQEIKANASTNPYYWIHEEFIRIYDSTDKKSNSKMSSMVLTRFQEEDE